MKKVILTITSLLVVFSVASQAELTNYYVKQAKAQEHSAINMNTSVDNSFGTQILNENLHVTHR